jgi:hypothetical protein
MLSDDDEIRIEQIIRRIIEEKLDELKFLIRHQHNDIDSIRREIFYNDERLVNFIFAVSKCLHFDDKTFDETINLSPEIYDRVDEFCITIDEADDEGWNKHLKNVKEGREKAKEYDKSMHGDDVDE